MSADIRRDHIDGVHCPIHWARCQKKCFAKGNSRNELRLGRHECGPYYVSALIHQTASSVPTHVYLDGCWQKLSLLSSVGDLNVHIIKLFQEVGDLRGKGGHHIVPNQEKVEAT